MAEYIEREAAVNVCSAQYKECLRKSDWCGDTVAWNIGFGIKAIPAADVAPVVHGHWDEGVNNGYCCCSNCRDVYILQEWLTDGKWNYCPNCGARMDGDG